MLRVSKLGLLGIVLVCLLIAGSVVSARNEPPHFTKFDAGTETFSPAESLIVAAATDWRAVYVQIFPIGSAGDSVHVQWVQNATRGETLDETVLVLTTAAKTSYEFYGAADTIVIKGEIAATTDASYFIGYKHFGLDSGVGAP